MLDEMDLADFLQIVPEDQLEVTNPKLKVPALAWAYLGAPGATITQLKDEAGQTHAAFGESHKAAVLLLSYSSDKRTIPVTSSGQMKSVTLRGDGLEITLQTEGKERKITANRQLCPQVILVILTDDKLLYIDSLKMSSIA